MERKSSKKIRREEAPLKYSSISERGTRLLWLMGSLSGWDPRISWMCSWWRPSPCKAGRCRCWKAPLKWGWSEDTERVVWFLTNFESNIREVIKVGGIIYRLDLYRDGSRSLPDVAPVNPPEPVQTLDVVNTLESLVSLITEPADQHWEREREEGLDLTSL